MSEKIQNAINRLNKILPLARRQKNLAPELINIHQMILKSYVELGRTLNKAEITEHVKNIDEAINTLRSNDLVIFDDNNEPVGAYPFTMEQRDHKIKINGKTVYAMCAFDALAISSMFNMPTRIESKCHVTGGRISIDQFNNNVLNKNENTSIHFGISWESLSNNCSATSLCTEMVFLKDKEVAEAWTSSDLTTREIFTLDEAIDFSVQFFKSLR